VSDLPAETIDLREGAAAQPAATTFGTPLDLNLIGLWTLYRKEVWRFLKVPGQTLAAPVVTALIFMLVFAVALGRGGRMVGGVPFLQFVAPGLIMMAIIQNAFANTSSSILIAKIQGNIVDVLMPPFRPGELLAGILAGGITRGLAVALAVGLAMLLAADLWPAHWWAILFFALGGSLMMALLGMIGGIWAEKFDQMAAVTNFVIMPLSFLSGTFYSVEQLPAAARLIAHLNPFFYLIDGLRFGFIGHADGSLAIGIAVTLLVNAVLWLAAYRMLATGYRLKA
jgi:ABC-2 type transport system permease protein